MEHLKSLREGVMMEHLKSRWVVEYCEDENNFSIRTEVDDEGDCYYLCASVPGLLGDISGRKTLQYICDLQNAAMSKG